MGKNNYTLIENIINIAKRGGMFILVDDERREPSDANAAEVFSGERYEWW